MKHKNKHSFNYKKQETEKLGRRNFNCPNCKRRLDYGGHFIPPSMGEVGYFACDDLGPIEDKKREEDQAVREASENPKP